MVACMAAVTMNAQCVDWLNPDPAQGWTDFNSEFGGAPVPDADGNCPFNELSTFQVYASEAYAIDNFVVGSEYTFSICNGPDAGSWIPEFTIIAPSGTVDAFGPGDGDGCSITWTASEAGTYLIVINEAGECGGGPNIATNNGYPAITCTGNMGIADNKIKGFEYFTQQNVLKISADKSFSNIDLYNILGQKVLSQKLSNTEENISLSSLNTGVYLAKVNVNGKMASFKIVKR